MIPEFDTYYCTVACVPCLKGADESKLGAPHVQYLYEYCSQPTAGMPPMPFAGPPSPSNGVHVPLPWVCSMCCETRFFVAIAPTEADEPEQPKRAVQAWHDPSVQSQRNSCVGPSQAKGHFRGKCDRLGFVSLVAVNSRTPRRTTLVLTFGTLRDHTFLL